MTPDQFEDALRKGLGRTIQHLRSHSAQPFRHIILDACLEDWRYDRQCESSRSSYLFELVHTASLAEECREALFHRLLTSAVEGILPENFRLASEFAKRGDRELHRAVYTAFDRCAAVQDFSGDDELICLDGLDGFLHAAEKFLTAHRESDSWLLGSWICHLEERDGEEAAWKSLDNAALSRPELAFALEAERASRRLREVEREDWTRPVILPPWPEMREHLLNNRRPNRIGAVRWSRDTDDASFREAAEDVVHETDEQRLFKLLLVFMRRPWPLAPGYLLSLVEHAEPRLSWRAAVVLSNVEHPDVRSLALRLSADPDRAAASAWLLTSNWRAGDSYLMERLLRASDNPDDVHDVGFAIRDIAKKNPCVETDDLLGLLYEREPCAMCRYGVVKHLLERDALPATLNDECRFDAYLAIRELV